MLQIIPMLLKQQLMLQKSQSILLCQFWDNCGQRFGQTDNQTKYYLALCVFPLDETCHLPTRFAHRGLKPHTLFKFLAHHVVETITRNERIRCLIWLSQKYVYCPKFIGAEAPITFQLDLKVFILK